MIYVIVFSVGFIMGIVAAANIMMNSDIEKREEAYLKGIEEGKRVALKSDNNIDINV